MENLATVKTIDICIVLTLFLSLFHNCSHLLFHDHKQNPSLRLNSHILLRNPGLSKQPLNPLLATLTTSSVSTFSGFAPLHFLAELPAPITISKKSKGLFR